MRTLFSTLVAAAIVLPGAATAAPAGSKSDADAVERVQILGRCMARSHGGDIHKLILTDHRSADYRRRIEALQNKHVRCVLSSGGGNWRSPGLLYVGALAEGMLHERRLLANLASLTAYDPNRPAIQANSAGDVMAYCMVRRQPAQVGALLGTRAATDAELAALKELGPVLSGCVPANSKSEFTREALRALIALNAYRLYAHNGGGAR
ncbi:MAG: DNA replication terminus site-binding protein [Pseudomonadota bacterium]|nr:DNA replication terminus site-binding protein [Pseudomonadota bacterium]